MQLWKIMNNFMLFLLIAYGFCCPNHNYGCICGFFYAMYFQRILSCSILRFEKKVIVMWNLSCTFLPCANKLRHQLLSHVEENMILQSQSATIWKWRLCPFSPLFPDIECFYPNRLSPNLSISRKNALKKILFLLLSTWNVE